MEITQNIPADTDTDRPELLSTGKPPYLTRQLIAYIGNKRRLLPVIEEAIRRCQPRIDSSLHFVDFFAGSGAVAKLAKLLGFTVTANDWELYASVLGEAFLVTGPAELAEMFPEHGGLATLLKKLNSLEHPERPNIARYYAPEATEHADPDRERLFYTRENGERIDAVREWIEAHYPGPQEGRQRREKQLLLGLLVYEAATHANTSGVFKAFHRGFGGRGKDALTRIMGRIELEYPELVAGRADMRQMDALKLARDLAAEGRRVDIAYLDPPYNQHQYGSNYHLLNTVVLNDRPTGEMQKDAQGRSKDKGGIRRDWVETRSAYCYRQSAEHSFRELVESIETRYLLVSYSTEGMIPFENLLDILAGRGRIDIVVRSYTRYRGGKQALTTTTSNLEFVLIADTEQECRRQDIEHVRKVLLERQIRLLLKRSLSPAVLVERGFQVRNFSSLDSDLVMSRELSPGLECRIVIDNFKDISNLSCLKAGQTVALTDLPLAELGRIQEELIALTQISRREELAVTLNWIRYLEESGRPQQLLRALADLPGLLKKFNDRKAYESSLLYLFHSLQLVHRCRRLVATVQDEKRLTRITIRLEKIARLKLSVSSENSLNIDRLRVLRSAVSRSLERLQG